MESTIFQTFTKIKDIALCYLTVVLFSLKALVGRVIHVKKFPFPGSSGIKEIRYTVRVLSVFKVRNLLGRSDSVLLQKHLN